MTPTARTLQHCRKLGYRAEVVERWNPHSRTRKDLFGFIDIVAVTNDSRLLAIQATSGSNVAARVTKIRKERAAELADWLLCGGYVEVWGWAKRGARGKRKVWSLRVVIVEAP